MPMASRSVQHGTFTIEREFAFPGGSGLQPGSTRHG